ncbi:DUF3429 domain-containing protein [Croceibacterium ferulae]|uniref:DUF3429 domain-containing protein n=1 Tax=Croceibacterium ferulae TaxID=1854641 RepID=UPI000EB0F126|nr:DUF3429 domain-containing protein [Croceibacterium ferulae]
MTSPAPRNDTPDRTPPLSAVLAFGPAGLIVALGLLGWAGWPAAILAGRLWTAAILLFLAGVARGLSFFTEGGPRPAQLAAMLVRFVCGVLALALPMLPIGAAPFLSWLLLFAGYLTVLLFDPRAARHGMAPRYFARLRGPQMFVALTGIVILAAADLTTASVRM